MSTEMEDLKKELSRVKALNGNLQDYADKIKAEEKSKKNQNFVQLYKEHLRDIRRLNNRDVNAINILLIMVEKMNKQNALIISQKNLEKITNKSRATIGRSIKVLKEERFLDIIKIGTSNAYIVNASVFWQDDAKMKGKLAIFEATVFASEDEQEENYFENWKGVKLKTMPILHGEIAIEAPSDKKIEGNNELPSKE